VIIVNDDENKFFSFITSKLLFYSGLIILHTSLSKCYSIGRQHNLASPMFIFQIHISILQPINNKVHERQFTPSHFHFNIILPSTPTFHKWSLQLRFSNQNSVCISHFPVYKNKLPCHLITQCLLLHMIWYVFCQLITSRLLTLIFFYS